MRRQASASRPTTAALAARVRAPKPAPIDEPPAPPPSWRRDPWAWLAVLSVVPLVLHSLGAPLGEPFADDFDYLRRVVLESRHSWLDGGGFSLYWRPLGRQAYFGLLAPVMLRAPGWIAALHVGLLALTAWLLYRAMRVRLSGPAAAAAASFVPLMESARMLIAWPSHFMDLGAMLFAALALHEAARARWRTAVPAVLASVLCKEVGALTLLLLPWMPGSSYSPRRRLRWFLGLATALAAWGAAYAWVAARAGFSFAATGDASGASRLKRVTWALVHGVRAAFNLPESSFASPALAWVVYGGLAITLALAALRIASSAAARRRVVRALPWSAWGIAWFALASAPLAAVYPTWAPYRSAFAAVGLGVALAAPLAAADPRLLILMAGVRVLTLGVSPGPPRSIAQRPSEYGAAFDFERLVRMERLVRGARHLLRERFARLPHGAAVGHHHLPQLTRFGFAGGKALQVWYRDSTLRWVAFEELRGGFDSTLVTIVEYQPYSTPQLALVEPKAMRAVLEAGAALDAREFARTLEHLARADLLQRDSNAVVFRGLVEGKRALAHAYLMQTGEAERAAEASLALWRDDTDARLVLAGLWSSEGRLGEAMEQLDTLRAIDPTDRRARELAARIRVAAGAR